MWLVLTDLCALLKSTLVWYSELKFVYKNFAEHFYTIETDKRVATSIKFVY